MTSERPAGTPPECPAHERRFPLYGAEFASDPSRVYDRMRERGPIARVNLAPGVPAALVVGYQAALDVLRDPVTFPKDPRAWQQTVPADCPVLPMMEYRPNCLFADGNAHTRLRGAVTDSLARVDPAVLRDDIERIAGKLIAQFRSTGHADLIAHYARVVPLLFLNELFGCPPGIGERLLIATRGIFEGIDADQANAELTRAVQELIVLKRKEPGADVTSWLMAHPARLTDDEVGHQLILLAGASVEPEQNLIANTVRLLLSDDRFGGDLSGGSLPVEEALDEVLWTDPPMANYGVTHPASDVEVAGVRLGRAEPVVISFAAANNDPTLAAPQRTGNRAHLAWSAGPHACPAQGMARLVASVAIEKLLDELPGMELAVPVEDLVWRPGPFHRALTALPVRFPPISARPDEAGEIRWTDSALTRSTPPVATFTPKPPHSAAEDRQHWWSSLAKWWHGQ